MTTERISVADGATRRELGYVEKQSRDAGLQSC